MQGPLSWLGGRWTQSALRSGLLLAIACTEERPGTLFPESDAGPRGRLSGGGGRGGSTPGGTGGAEASTGGLGGSGAAGSLPGGSGGRDAGAGGECSVDADCDVQEACTTRSCQGGACAAAGFAAPGTPCGSATDDACTDPDTCDALGVCQPKHTPGSVGLACGSSADDACTDPDTCDAQGVCRPNDEVLGTLCGSSTDDECTDPDVCDDFGQCSPNNAAVGTLCGSSTDDECAKPDVCGNGVCLPNDVANGTACTAGSCGQGQCVSGQPVGCPVEVVNSVPFTTTWSSVDRPNLYVGACDSADTPDYALVFTAPQAGTFRFTVTGLVDSTPYTGADTGDPITEPPDGDGVITVAEGSCAGGGATPVACNDDLVPGMLDSQLDLPLTDQQVITLYLNEYTQTGGGTGTLSISLQL